MLDITVDETLRMDVAQCTDETAHLRQRQQLSVSTLRRSRNHPKTQHMFDCHLLDQIVSTETQPKLSCVRRCEIDVNRTQRDG